MDNKENNSKLIGEENKSVLTEQTQAKAENMRKAFEQMDKNLDSVLSQEELISFLDSNMKNGQKFDRSLANKIFEALDLDHNGKISVEEFIKNYLMIDNEIKSHSKELQNKYITEKEKHAQIQKLLLENRSEIINTEGISQNAKITIEIYNIEFVKIIDYLKRLSIRIRFDGENKETRLVSNDNNIAVWRERFEL